MFDRYQKKLAIPENSTCSIYCSHLPSLSHFSITIHENLEETNQDLRPTNGNNKPHVSLTHRNPLSRGDSMSQTSQAGGCFSDMDSKAWFQMTFLGKQHTTLSRNWLCFQALQNETTRFRLFSPKRKSFPDVL